jgi:hypothetical protein
MRVPVTRFSKFTPSLPDGGEIYFDGKFYGNTPSDINRLTGEHVFNVKMYNKEWNRSVQITGSQITVHTE